MGTVFQNTGWIIGETFSMAVLFNFTKDLKLQTSFHIAAATLALFGIVMTALTKTHVRADQREKKENN